MRSVLILLTVTAAVALQCDATEPLLEVRLQNHLTSYSSPPGTAFRCVVIRSFEVYGRTLIPKGSTVYGTVVKQRRVGLGLIRERAGLTLSFDSYETPDRRRYEFETRLTAIDNARETVTRKGEIKGILAANNPGNLLNGFWARPTLAMPMRSLLGLTGTANQVWLKYSGGPIGAAGIFAIRCLIFPFPEPEIHLPPGTDMKLAVRLPLLDEVRPVTAAPSEVRAELSGWMGDKLDSILHRNGETAADLVNVALIGSRQEIISAFVTSSWIRADHRSVIASSRVYQAFSLKKNYASAPVSRLLYRGREPDLVFEKSFDTVTQRHHIRLWNAGLFEGREIWLGAATHDTGVAFQLSSVSFTHKIDKDIDLERDKVATDLTFSGCTGSAQFLNAGALSELYKEGKVTTDGQLVMLSTQPCAVDNRPEDAPGPPGTKVTRLTRRVFLEARNYLLRDNAYYWAYRLIRSRSLAQSIPE